MIKKRAAALAFVLALLLGQAAGASSYSFPDQGLRLAAEDTWTLLTPQTLQEQQPLLAQLGADIDVVRADYAANHTVFEVYMEGSVQVALTAVATEQTEVWQDMAYMSEADKDDFFLALSQPPYENTRWADGAPGIVAYEWTLEAGGMPVAFAALSTVRQGMLYTLTAVGADQTVEALHTANTQVLGGLEFLGLTSGGQEGAAQRIEMPVAIEDDGVVTPLILVDFTGISYDEMTVLTVETLPGAEVMLQTATDTLRGKANEAGQNKYTVSTKRETVYEYTITAQAEGRTASSMHVALDRRLTPEAQAEAYRKSAKQLYALGYMNLVNSPETYKNDVVTFRGRVGAFGDVAGFPSVLIYTENPGKGVWKNPMWVVLTEPLSLEVEDIRTVYGDLRGDTMAYVDEDGQTQQAPVVISQSVSE